MRCNFKGKNNCENSLSLKPNGTDFYKLCDLHRAIKNKENELSRKQKQPIEVDQSTNCSPSVEEKKPLVVLEESPVIPVNPIFEVTRPNLIEESDSTPRTKEEVRLRKALYDTTINFVGKNIEKSASDTYHKIYRQLKSDAMSFDDQSFQNSSIIADILQFESHADLKKAYKAAIYESKFETWESFFSAWTKKIPATEIPQYVCPDKDTYVDLERNSFDCGYIISVLMIRRERDINMQLISFTNDQFQWVKWRGEYHMYIRFTMSIFLGESSFRQDIYVPAPVYLWFNYKREHPQIIVTETYVSDFKKYMSCHMKEFRDEMYPSMYLEASNLITTFNELYFKLTMRNQWQSKTMSDFEKKNIISKLQIFKEHPEYHKFFPDHFVTHFLSFLEFLQKSAQPEEPPLNCKIVEV